MFAPALITFTSLTTLLGALGAPAPAPALTISQDEHMYRIRFKAGTLSPGHSATFGCCTLYNYTAVPDGEPIHVGGNAPKFFYEGSTSALNTPTTIELHGAVSVQCFDAGSSPSDGTQLTLQQCHGGSGQLFVVGGDRERVRLDGTDLCMDVPDADTSKAVQLWSCHDPWHPDASNQWWTTRQMR